MLSFEFEPPNESGVCSCCGGKTTALTRYVFKDGDAYAIYYVRFSTNHPERFAVATISIGEWGEGSTPEQRVAFAFELRTTNNEYQVGLIDSAHSPWREAKTIGRTLDREEALKHPLLSEVFHITDHMVVEDKELKAYFNAQ
jgi:hypothetical protein